MKLFLKDGDTYDGKSFGADTPIAGELVFSTGMTGYVESLTDPSFAGQILVCTYPLIGNYGVPSKEKWESNKIHIAGLIVSEYSEEYSHFDAEQSLGSWLKHSGVPALSGIDTRALTKKIRTTGAILSAIANKKPKKFPDPNMENLVAKVSPIARQEFGTGKKRILAFDCGMKENIMRNLMRHDTTIIRVPYNHDISKEKYDAVFISNGPGDPAVCIDTISQIKKAMRTGKPILGICLGNQLLALASGAKTYKLPFGHRGQNQPCQDMFSKRVYITSQNHGYAIDAESLPRGWDVWFTNTNDKSIEGIRHASKPWQSVQFHPEASPGPTDTAWIFDQFIKSI